MGRLKNKLFAKILTRLPALGTALFDKKGNAIEGLSLETIPWTPVTKPLSESTIALVTTAGIHLKSQTPFDMHDSMGDPTFRELPLDTPPGELTITHDYYDHADADKDINVVYPVDRMRELVEAGEIGSLVPVNFGFMGHIDGHYVKRLIEQTGPEVADRLKAMGADAVLLTPG